MSSSAAWLVAVLAVPGAVAAVGLLRIDAERMRRVALAGAGLLVAVTLLPLLGDPPPASPGVADAPILGVDELSRLLVPFAALLWLLAVGVTPRHALDRAGIRRTALATLVTTGVFLTRSPALLVLLWALSVLILLRGLAAGGFRRAHRVAATYLGASTLLFALGVAVRAVAGDGSPGAGAGNACILLAVMIRKGIAPLHGWIPEVLEHGRIGPVVLFSAPQVAAYVAIRLLVPEAAPAVVEATGVLALVTAVYGAAAAMTQSDARRAFGFLFVSQSALVFAGLESGSVEGLTGGLSLWLSSGIAFAALARCLSVLEARRGRLSLDQLNGGYERMPVLATSFLLTALAGVGFPGTLGFVGQELLVDGAVAEHPRTGFLVIVAGAFAGIAVLRIYFSLFCGRTDRGPSLGLRSREVLILASFSALLLATGLAPRPILGSRAAAAAEILAGRESPPPPEAGRAGGAPLASAGPGVLR